MEEKYKYPLNEENGRFGSYDLNKISEIGGVDVYGSILVDKKTGVEYMLIRSIGEINMVPLLKSRDGSVDNNYRYDVQAKNAREREAERKE